MAEGMAMGSLLGGVGSMMGAYSADKAGKEAAKLAEEAMKKAEEAISKGISGYQGSIEDYKAAYPVYEKQWQAGMQQLMSRIGFGDNIMSGAMGSLDAGGNILGQAQGFVGQVDSIYAQGRDDLLQGKQYAKDFYDTMSNISGEYSNYTQSVWNEWESMFGDMRQNLVDYYDNMDADKYAIQWKGDIRKNMDTALKEFDEQAARSGIYTSGQKLQAMKEKNFQQAQAFQEADLKADDYVMDRKTQFYGQFGEPERVMAQDLMGKGILNKAQMAGAAYAPLMETSNNLANYQQMWGSNKLGQAGSLANIGNAFTNQAGTAGDLADSMYGTGTQIMNPYLALGNTGMNSAGNVLRGQGNVMNQYTNLANLYTGQQNAYNSSDSGYGKSAGSLFGSGANLLSSGLKSMFG